MTSRKVLDVITASEVTRVYQDVFTAAKTDLSIFQANLASVPVGYYITGQVAVPYHAPTTSPSSIVLVKPLVDEEVIKPPNEYHLMWSEEGSKGTEKVSIWQVEAPDGYVALGDVAVPGHDKPTDAFSAKYACIKRELLTPGRLSDVNIWNDHGSHASVGCSLWRVENQPLSPGGLAGFFKANSNYNRPENEVYVLPVDVTCKN